MAERFLGLLQAGVPDRIEDHADDEREENPEPDARDHRAVSDEPIPRSHDRFHDRIMPHFLLFLAVRNVHDRPFDVSARQ
jgi:hypothetical protein